jgi:hypothetical protein
MLGPLYIDATPAIPPVVIPADVPNPCGAAGLVSCWLIDATAPFGAAAPACAPNGDGATGCPGVGG